MDNITNIVDLFEIHDLRTNQRDTPRPTPAKRGELWFDPWLNPRGEALAMLVEDIFDQFTSAEPPRRRARSVKAEASLKRTIEAVVCNLALAVIKKAEAGLGVVVPMGSGGKRKQSRYHRTGIPKKALPKVIRTLTLVQPPVLALQTGSKGQSTSTITATDWFVTRIEGGAVSEADFGRHKVRRSSSSLRPPGSLAITGRASGDLARVGPGRITRIRKPRTHIGRRYVA